MEQRTPQKKGKIWGVLFAIILLMIAVFLALLLGRVLERRTYLLNYRDEIRQNAVEYDLDPYTVASIIHCESGNRPEIVSRAGAIGLMQIMPDTGEWIAGKLKMADYTVEKLNTPDVNIRFGCWYLRFLLDRYHENLSHALAAYNAGHGNVDKWLLDPDVTDDGELVNIPFSETEEYGKKVQRAYEKYLSLYPDAF